MIKTSRILTANEIRYDYIGGPNDEVVVDVVETDYSGGSYVPAKLSGHPDSWHPDESEDPEVTCDLEVWLCPDEDANLDPLNPTFPSQDRGRSAQGASAVTRSRAHVHLRQGHSRAGGRLLEQTEQSKP